MVRKAQFEEIPIGGEEFEEKFADVNENISARLRIDPPLGATLIQKIKMIKGVGWVSDGVDYTAIFTVSPKEILLESGCPAWCGHMQRIVYEIVEALKQEGEVDYKGPSLSPLMLNRF